jgi:HEPN domain-containing protein
MSPEKERAAEAREWLAKAALDLRAAQVDFAAAPPLLEDALFHCQQAVEKSLKAFLVWHDVVFKKTRSVEELGRRCCEIDAELTGLIDEAAPLTEFAWAFRYPGAAPVPDEVEAHDALRITLAVVSAIVGRLPSDAVPPGLPEGSN